MTNQESLVRERASAVKLYRCKNLIAVIENPSDIKNIGTVIRNVNALGVEKTYIVDPKNKLPDEWQDMSERKSLSKTSVSAIKWSFVKRFASTEDFPKHLEQNRYVSVVTSPHIKSKKTVILHEGDYTHPRISVWFGNESKGVNDLSVQRSEFCVTIPMFGMIESLKLDTTSVIVLYEKTKQRRIYQEKFKRARHGPKRRGTRSE